MNAKNFASYAIDILPLPSGIRLTLCGEANMSAVEALGAALENVHGRALSLASVEVVFDVTQLNFMSSTCLKQLLTWILRVEDLGPSAGYRIRILSHPGIPWQKRSLRAIETFAPGRVTVERM